MAETSAPKGGSALDGFLERQFQLTGNGTTVRTEFVAGATTFLTMVYIVFVNPEILSSAGMDRGAVFVATCLAPPGGWPPVSIQPNRKLQRNPDRQSAYGGLDFRLQQ